MPPRLCCRRCWRRCVHIWTEAFGNASSIHQPGQQAGPRWSGRAIGCRARWAAVAAEVVFTSGGTESDNLALFGVLLSPGDHLITSSMEHAAGLHAAQELARRGVEVTFLPATPQGLVEPSALEAALRPNTRLVSVMLANNETGVIQPVRELADLSHAAGALFHTDAVQAAGKLALDVKALGCDMLSLSGHKMYAPQGVGALFVGRNVRLRPIFFGGNHERGRRPGTENVAGIVGLGKAAELAREWLAKGEQQSLATCAIDLEQGILAQVEEAGINGAGAARVCQHQQYVLRPCGGGGAGDRARPEGAGGLGWVGLPVGSDRTVPCVDGDGLSPARARASVRFSLSRLTTGRRCGCARWLWSLPPWSDCAGLAPHNRKQL